YHCATHYLGIGIKLLDGNAWVSRHELAYRLHFEQAQCAYLSSHFEEALLQFRALRVHAKTALAQAEVVRGEIDVHTLAWELREAVDCAIDGLRILGMEIDAHPEDAQVKLEYNLIWKHLGNRSIGQLADLAPMADAQKEAVLLVLAALQPASFFTDRNLYLFCCCRMVNVSIQHGNSRVSVIAYGALGVSMGPAFGQYREGFEFGQLITRLVERPELLAHKAEIHFMVGGMINPWLRPLSSCLDWLERGFKVAGDVGDLIFACYCGVQTVLQKFVRGDALDTVDAESERFLEFTRKARSSASSQMILGLQRLILAIRGMSTRVATFESADFSEHSYETDLAGSGPSIVSCGYYIVKLQARFLFGEFEEALIAGSIARSLLWSLLGTIPEFQYHYFDALALAAQVRKGGPEPSLALLQMHHAKLGEWAGNCPETFFHAYALVSAELARIRGDDPKAADFYEQAIRSAHENGFVPNEGIAYELAFRFYMERGFEVSAKAYLHEARGCYARWGAEGKVRQLEALHPWLLDPMSPERGTVATGHEQLDLMTVVKASQAISSEIDLSHLLDILLRIVQENAGAQKVALLLADDFKIAATLECGQSRPAAPAPASSTVPLSIIHYVIRTHEKVLLKEATSDARFARDQYIVEEKPKSVLCLPILNQSALVGLLYLENNLVPGAFTSHRLAVLELLASQAAISLRNAVLYSELQQENHVRKQAEEEVHQLNAELEERVDQRTMQLRRSLEKEELLRKEVHHRVKNNLQVISSLLYLQSLDSRDPGTQEVLRESQSRTRTIALIHEKLYQSSDVKQIDFDVYTRQLAASLIDSYQPKRGSVRLNIRAEGVLLSPDVAVPCGLIINELVSNALKYAFPEQTGGEIEIDFHPAQDGFFKLRVRDTGRGLPAGFDLGKTSTLGVRLVRDLTLQLNGTVEFKSENGTVVNITFPDSAP
ncbi:MAG: hypothetical protein JWL90_4497, partial [Chthoniobacteraceae bacterium]|nr:hypothetical protein [Chthoniobacteraceae bacterium]